MEITKKLIANVKRHRNQTWHDQGWHNFNNRPEVEAVCYALDFMPDRADDQEIISIAENYLATEF